MVFNRVTTKQTKNHYIRELRRDKFRSDGIRVSPGTIFILSSSEAVAELPQGAPENLLPSS